MCGILGRVDILGTKSSFQLTADLSSSLSHRGPDHQSHLIDPPVVLGHTRLSIIDLEERSNQPLTDISGRYTLVFNGEIYNYKELRQECIQLGYSFRTESDTEVLLVLYIHFGASCLKKLNGFFAFAVYDRNEKSLFIARDRFGIKPLVFYHDKNDFAFASEMKVLLKMGFEHNIDKVSLFNYFKFNYIPAPHSILKHFYKLEPGHCLSVKWTETEVLLEESTWYTIPYDAENEKELTVHDYQQAQRVLTRFLRESVSKRLVADVTVGTFLSGGIDSSIITALAAEQKSDIEAFSLGFPDNKFYDESPYAASVAKHLGVKHHLFEVRSRDLLEASEHVLAHLDEPFADSSAMNVYLLSQHTKNHVKVALSGDGGDELFAGYNKHSAEFRIRHPKLIDHFAGSLEDLWEWLPNSRSSGFGNLVRQLQKFSDGYQLSPRDRYWRWAGILNEEQTNYLIREQMLEREHRLSDDGHTYKRRKDYLLKHIHKSGSMNEVLLSDMHMVLPNDMLYKVDSMSMAHGLEVRTPMLDHHVVKHAFKLPVMFKVNHKQKKKILRDTFASMLPSEVFERGKKGFEVPLLEWFQGPMRSRFTAVCEDHDWLNEHGLLNKDAIDDLKAKLFSKNPGDAPATAWALLVFHAWYKQHM